MTVAIESPAERSLLSGRDVIIISSIDWGSLWQSHQDIASRLARDGSRVLFIENTGIRSPRLPDLDRVASRARRWFRARKAHGIRTIEPRLDVLSPLILPPFGRLRRAVNRKVFIERIAETVDSLGLRDPIVWTYLPTDTALDIYDRVATARSRLVYYCIADFALLARDAAVVDRERELVERADVVFVNREEFAARFRGWNPNVHVFPVGVNMNAFVPGVAIAESVRHLPRPRIGCVGALHEIKSDFSFLAVLARRRPDWSWIYVGPRFSRSAELEALANVFLIDEVPHAALASHIEGFDACIVPYRQTDFMRTSVPTKINEYLAMGKPVVATPCSYSNEMSANGAIDVAAHDPAAFIAAIETCLEDTSDARAAQRRLFASRADWTERLASMCGIVRDALWMGHGLPASMSD